MAIKYTNNASAVLSASITSTTTSFSVTSGNGALFPSTTGGDYFYITVVDTASGDNEIVKVTTRSSDTFTVVRGQDGTTARAFAAGAKVELRIVRALLDAIRSYEATSASYGTLMGRTDTGVYSAPTTLPNWYWMGTPSAYSVYSDLAGDYNGAGSPGDINAAVANGTIQVGMSLTLVCTRASTGIQEPVNMGPIVSITSGSFGAITITATNAVDWSQYQNTGVWSGYKLIVHQFTLSGFVAENVTLGMNAGVGITTGGENVLIGTAAGNNVGSGNNNVVIGNAATASAQNVSNEVTLGNSLHTKTRLFGALALGGSAVGTTGQVLVSQGAGTAPIWSTVSSDSVLPSQTGNSGKFLTTDGSSVSWGSVNLSAYLANSGGTLTGDLVLQADIPRFDLYEQDSSLTSKKTTLTRNADVTAFQTRQADGTFISNDYRMTIGATGVSTHEWRVANSVALTLDSTGLAVSGTGKRITGDFSNATVTSRLAFQTSTANTATSLGVLPNGTSTQSGINFFNNSDPTNASALNLTVTSAEAQLRSNITGTGTYLPLAVYVNNAKRFQFGTAGQLGVGATPDYGTSGYFLKSGGASAAPTWSALASSDVTTALGYTPYNSTNPSGYITSSSNISGTSGGIGVSAPVLATATESNSIYITAPSYSTDTPVKLLNFDWYGNLFSMGNIRSGATPSNGFGIYYTASGGSRTEIARFGTGGSFNATGALTQGGNQVLHAGNYSSYALPLTGGTLTGSLNGTVAYFSSYINTSGPYYRNAAGGGYLNGQYGSVESVGTTGVIYSIGGSYVPTSTSYNNMYGVAYAYSGAGRPMGTVAGIPSDHWAFVGLEAGTPKWALDTSNGSGYFTGQLYTGTGNLVLNASNYNSYSTWINTVNTGDIINIGYTSLGSSVATTNARGIELHNSGGRDYWIGKRAGAWTQPLDVAFYTGIRYHAHSSYGGHRFFAGGYDSTEVFSVGNGDSNTRIYGNLYMSGNGTMYSGASSLIIGQYGSATRGYLYNDTGGFGFLSYNGNWAAYVPYGTTNFTIAGSCSISGYTALHSGNITSYAPGSVSGARAWVNFNGTGTTSANQTINSSYNVSSVYKNAGADWTINYTAAIGNNHALVVTSRIGGGSNGAGSGGAIPQIYGTNGTANSLTTTTARFFCYNTLTGASAGDIICAVAFSQ